MPLFSSRFSLLVCLWGLGFSSAPGQPAILDKARAFIGSENAIAAVQGLRFIGELEVAEGELSSGGAAKIEIVFQKPYCQRITATSENRSEITALDGFDAWQRVINHQNSSRWEVNFLGADQIKRLRANTFENLSFFRGLEQVGGQLKDLGESTVDGIFCHKVAFVHGPGIAFTRSFEVATGRLVLTETESGTQIREEGELRAGDLHFPQRITTTNLLPDGNKRTIRVTFTAVEVNPGLDAAVFAVPTLRE